MLYFPNLKAATTSSPRPTKRNVVAVRERGIKEALSELDAGSAGGLYPGGRLQKDLTYCGDRSKKWIDVPALLQVERRHNDQHEESSPPYRNASTYR